MAEGHPPQQRHRSLRRQARLDRDTHAELEELAKALHRKHAAILRYVMHWELAQTQGWTIDRFIPATARPVAMLVEPEVLQQVQPPQRSMGSVSPLGSGT